VGPYKMGTRYYDPAVGRFTQLGLLGDGYLYALNDPVNLNDPTGYQWGKVAVQLFKAMWKYAVAVSAGVVANRMDRGCATTGSGGAQRCTPANAGPDAPVSPDAGASSSDAGAGEGTSGQAADASAQSDDNMCVVNSPVPQPESCTSQSTVGDFCAQCAASHNYPGLCATICGLE
jgi:uncharacterized protein RhaS with RHS repeats